MPQLLLDREKCLKNIERMANKANDKGLSFRPHCKTHQSAEIAAWFRDFGVKAITVSSFKMAAYFTAAGWEDILVAFPFVPGDLDSLNTLSKKATISILLDNPDTLHFLEKLEQKTPFYVDVDTGYGRSGIKAENTEEIEALLLAARNNKKLQFKGFYCHAGHSYKTSDPAERLAIHRKSTGDLSTLKRHFQELNPLALYGDTPNCSTQENFSGIDEITPGNFVFYDLTQVMLGSCKLEDVAVAMECQIAGKYTESRNLLIHGGGVHFSKESLTLDGQVVYGQLVNRTEGEWNIPEERQLLTGLSQEHGLLENCGLVFESSHIGDKILTLPVHSCMTANLMRSYKTLDNMDIHSMNVSSI